MTRGVKPIDYNLTSTGNLSTAIYIYIYICMYVYNVTPPKLASANPVESLAIYPFKPTCDQTGNHSYKNVRVNVREDE
jgi:hypothetical protein